MKETIKTKDGKLIIETPLKTKRYCPFDGKKYGEMNNVVGFVWNEGEDDEEYGFSYVIDMAYKGKDDQYATPFYSYTGELEDFEKLCKKIKVPLVYEDTENN